jgi:hypothetical protein
MNRTLKLIVLTGFLCCLLAPERLFAQAREPNNAAKANRKAPADKPGKALIAPKAEFDPQRVDEAKNHFNKALQDLKLNMVLSETEHLLVFTDLEKTEADSIAGLAEKTFLASCRLLKIEAPKTLFPTKLAILVLEKDQYFEPLQRAIFETPLTASRSVLWRTEGELPCVLVSSLPSYKFRTPGFSANWTQFTARFIGTLVLLRQYPVDATHSRLPVWIRNGFGLYASLVAQDDPELTRAYRSLFRDRLQDKVKIFDFSSGSQEFYNFHVTSVVEYLLAGGEANRFEALLQKLQKREVVRDDRLTLDVSMELEWDLAGMQLEWRYFAKTGKRLVR